MNPVPPNNNCIFNIILVKTFINIGKSLNLIIKEGGAG